SLLPAAAQPRRGAGNPDHDLIFSRLSDGMPMCLRLNIITGTTMRIAKLISVLLFLAASPALAEAPRVTIEEGPITGAVVNGVTVFKGIPYAAPPVGALRWKAPEPAAHWTAPRD